MLRMDYNDAYLSVRGSSLSVIEGGHGEWFSGDFSYIDPNC